TLLSIPARRSSDLWSCGRTTTTRFGSNVPFEESSVRATRGEPSALAWRPTRRVVQGMGGILGAGDEGRRHSTAVLAGRTLAAAESPWRRAGSLFGPA